MLGAAGSAAAEPLGVDESGREILASVDGSIVERLPLPAQPIQGRRWCDHRQVINVIGWIKRTGSPGRELSEGYGPSKAANGTRAS